jgi:ABC-type nitrate/sulfonate/bicarbonate transport system ATPase subunit
VTEPKIVNTTIRTAAPDPIPVSLAAVTQIVFNAVTKFYGSSLAVRQVSLTVGGMKQRVALARAIALQTKVILMDEPFASLDYQTRKLMQLYLLDAWERAGSTVLLVTHDLSEAITLADRLVVLSGAPGMIQDIIDIEAQRPRDTAQAKLAHLQSEIEVQLERAAAEAELTHEEQQRVTVRHNYG